MHDALRVEGEAAERTGYWDGDLRHIALRIWPEPDADVACVMVAQGGHVCVWMNPLHVGAGVAWLLWQWAQAQAVAQPAAVMYADELPAWTIPPGSMHAVPACVDSCLRGRDFRRSR